MKHTKIYSKEKPEPVRLEGSGGHLNHVLDKREGKVKPSVQLDKKEGFA